MQLLGAPPPVLPSGSAAPTNTPATAAAEEEEEESLLEGHKAAREWAQVHGQHEGRTWAVGSGAAATLGQSNGRDAPARAEDGSFGLVLLLFVPHLLLHARLWLLSPTFASQPQQFSQVTSAAESRRVELDLDATTSFFGVYDGHGGAEVAMYCAKRFHTMLLEDVDYINNLPNAITSDYVPPSYEGSTACVVIIRGNQIIVGNVGDSRCVLSKNGQAISLSFDHKPHHEAEHERIQRAGGHVFLRRILGMLATSRAIGDFAYKQNRNMPPSQQMVTCVPDIRVENITDDTEFLVIASDGVWDGMRNNNVVQFVRQELRPGEENLRETCEKLVGHCLHSNDNATAILVKFKPIEEDPDEVASARDEHQHNPEGGDEKLDINNDND
uniref:protein-serine/threonine phosphatase n=1 Tax=Oryza nivara TaxID=4536 RepID=A0A0E0G9N1_ORYNI